jgi:hypothetical protein
MLFLHGNVGVGFCSLDNTMGNVNRPCSKCGNLFQPTRLLYPITQKKYMDGSFIEKQWLMLREVLEKSFWVTIFGYSAPNSDVEAIDFFKEGWGDPNKRNMEEIEIIDIKEDNELSLTWSILIHSHHYRTEKDFYNSWLAKHPRRTGEAYINQYLDIKFIEDNLIPKNANFDELGNWFEPLFKAENDKKK